MHNCPDCGEMCWCESGEREVGDCVHACEFREREQQKPPDAKRCGRYHAAAVGSSISQPGLGP